MKIAFVNTDMNIGGIPKASIPLLTELSRKHQVDLILTNGGGEILKEVVDRVSVRILDSENYASQIKSALRDIRLVPLVRSIVGYFRASDWIESLAARIMLKHKIKGHYDLAIAYFGMNAKCVLTTLECIQADKYIAIMHGDHPFKGNELATMGRIYCRFDRLFSVSSATRLNFVRDYPECESKSAVLYNIMDVDKVKENANQSTPIAKTFDKDKLNIVTVGRISPEKGQLMIPEVADRLRKTGIAFKWHIVGDGNDREALIDKINELDLEDSILLHGNQLNPYPIIRAADIYVQPSYTEGYCLTIIEAAILGRPIIATKVGGSWEKFQEEAIMLCVPTADSIYGSVVKLVNDKRLRETMSEKVSVQDWSNISEIQKLENL